MPTTEQVQGLGKAGPTPAPSPQQGQEKVLSEQEQKAIAVKRTAIGTLSRLEEQYEETLRKAQEAADPDEQDKLIKKLEEITKKLIEWRNKLQDELPEWVITRPRYVAYPVTDGSNPPSVCMDTTLTRFKDFMILHYTDSCQTIKLDCKIIRKPKESDASPITVSVYDGTTNTVVTRKDGKETKSSGVCFEDPDGNRHYKFGYVKFIRVDGCHELSFKRYNRFRERVEFCDGFISEVGAPPLPNANTWKPDPQGRGEPAVLNENQLPHASGNPHNDPPATPPQRDQGGASDTPGWADPWVAEGIHYRRRTGKMDFRSYVYCDGVLIGYIEWGWKWTFTFDCDDPGYSTTEAEIEGSPNPPRFVSLP